MSQNVVNPYRYVVSFDPNSVSGLMLWLKADAGITKDGSDLVSAWTDQSDESNDVSQGTGSKQPKWFDNIQNGLPIVRFDGSDDSLIRATFVNGSLTSPNTIFCVNTMPSDSASERFVYNSGSGNHQAFLKSSTNKDYIYAGASLVSADASDPTNFHYYTLTYNGASSSIREDGAEIAAGDAGTYAMNGIELGSNHNSGSDYGDPDIGEILVYDSDITGDDLTNIEAYLAGRWGL